MQTLFLPKTRNPASVWEEPRFADVSTKELNISILNSTSRSRCQTTPPQNTRPQVLPALSFSQLGLCLSGVRPQELIGINPLPPTAQLGLVEKKHILGFFYGKTQVNRSEVKGHTMHFPLVLQKGKGTNLQQNFLTFMQAMKACILVFPKCQSCGSCAELGISCHCCPLSHRILSE